MGCGASAPKEQPGRVALNDRETGMTIKRVFGNLNEQEERIRKAAIEAGFEWDKSSDIYKHPSGIQIRFSSKDNYISVELLDGEGEDFGPMGASASVDFLENQIAGETEEICSRWFTLVCCKGEALIPNDLSRSRGFVADVSGTWIPNDEHIFETIKETSNFESSVLFSSPALPAGYLLRLGTVNKEKHLGVEVIGCNPEGERFLMCWDEDDERIPRLTSPEYFVACIQENPTDTLFTWMKDTPIEGAIDLVESFPQ